MLMLSSRRDVEDGFRRPCRCCLRIFIERRADDTVSVGQVRKEDDLRGGFGIRCVGCHSIYSVPQEIILHTLFESGVTRVGDLERYVQDEIVRYGGRLSELGKKLDNAYQEIVSPTQSCHLRSLAHSLVNRRTKAALSTTTRSSAMRLMVKITPSLLVGLPICMERISWVFASLASPPSLGYQVFPFRRSYCDRKGREWAPGALYRTWDQRLFSLLVHSPTVPLLTPQKQANGTSATLPTATSIRPARVNKDGGRSYWTLTTFLQVSFRCPCTTSSRSFQTSTAHHGWCRKSISISTYTTHPGAAVTPSPPLSNVVSTDCAATYTTSITSNTHPSGRPAKPGPNEDGASRTDRWREIDERCYEEEAEEGERANVARHWRRRRPWCRQWVGRRWDERSHQYERWERWSHSTNNYGRGSTRERWRHYRCDAGIDHGSSWNTRAGWYARRGTGGGEEERWAREGEEGKDVRSCFKGGHRNGVVMNTPLSGRVFPGLSISILSHHTLCHRHSPIYTHYHYVLLLISYDRYTRMGLVCTCHLREQPVDATHHPQAHLRVLDITHFVRERIPAAFCLA